MPLPTVEWCILCEDVRAEIGNKATVLGFFGLCPNVDIQFQRKPYSTSIMFLLGVTGGTGLVPLTSVLMDIEGRAIAQGPTIQMKAAPGKSNAMVGIGFTGIQFQRTGKHRFRVSTGGVKIYETTIGISEAPNIIRA